MVSPSPQPRMRFLLVAGALLIWTGHPGTSGTELENKETYFSDNWACKYLITVTTVLRIDQG